MKNTRTKYIFHLFICSHKSNMSPYSICFYHMAVSLVLSLFLLFVNHFVLLKFNDVFYILSQHLPCLLHLHLRDNSRTHLSLEQDSIKWHCMPCSTWEESAAEVSLIQRSLLANSNHEMEGLNSIHGELCTPGPNGFYFLVYWFPFFFPLFFSWCFEECATMHTTICSQCYSLVPCML